MALFVRKFGRFMKKKGYGARKRRDNNKSKEYVSICYNCKSPACPYNSDNDEDEKKKHKDKKEKKEKKEKRMTFQKKKKDGGYVVTWDSDGSLNSDDGKKSLASIAINNKPSIFDTPSTCLMAKPTKVKYDMSDDDCESDIVGVLMMRSTPRRSSWTCVSKCTLALR